jgi:hypothetical protein
MSEQMKDSGHTQGEAQRDSLLVPGASCLSRRDG